MKKFKKENIKEKILTNIGLVIGILVLGSIMLATTIVTFLIMFRVIPVPEWLYWLVVIRG